MARRRSNRVQRYIAAFSAGTLDPTLSARSDTDVYSLGCETLENVFVLPQGPAERRWGTVAVGRAPGRCIIEPFEFNESEAYFVLFSDMQVDIYNALTAELEATLDAYWTLDQLAQVRVTQFGDLMVVCHPDVAPYELRRLASSWELAAFEFTGISDADDTQLYRAYHQFTNATIDASATTGTITLTTSSAFWINQDEVRTHIGKYIRIKTGYVRITGVTSTTVATGVVMVNLPDHDKTDDWYEQAWSDLRGYPRSATLHEGRLYFGGSRDLPDQVWGSKVGDFHWFSHGTTDDAALSISTVSGQVGEIRHLQSGPGGLEIFKSNEEGVIPSAPNDPITPNTVAYRVQSRYGSSRARATAIDGATMFAQVDGGSVREFRHDGVQERYDAETLNIRAPSLINSPVWLASIKDAFNRKADFLFVVNGDGTVACLSTASTQNVAAWSKWVTQGTVISMASAARRLWWVVIRRNSVMIERFDANALMDCCPSLSLTPSSGSFTGLADLESELVDIVTEDGFVGQETVLSGGSVTNPTAADSAQIGLPFRFRLKTMPADQPGAVLLGRNCRIVEVHVRSLRDGTLYLNGKVLKRRGTSTEYSTKLLGWVDDPRVEIWQDGPHPVQLAALSFDLAVN